MDESLLGLLTSQGDVREVSVLGLLVISSEGTVVGHNLQFWDVWGLPPSLMQSQHADAIFELVRRQLKQPEGFIEQVNGPVAQPDWEYSGMWELRDGRIIWCFSQPFEEGAHCSGRVVGVRDLTDQRRTEDALKTALSLHKATIESTADGILVVDREGKIVSFNGQFVTMWQLPRTIVDSRDDHRALEFVLDQLHEPTDFLRKVRELYATPDEESFDILEFKDGRVFERYSKPQRVDGQTVGRVWSFRDVTEQRRAECALRTAHHLLEQRVEQRTAELSKANQALHQQLMERKLAEGALAHTMEHLQRLSQHILQLQEEEYRVLSRELHDNVAQSIFAVKMRVERVVMEAGSARTPHRQELQAIVAQLRTISHEVRRLSKQLRPEILDELGLIPAIQSYIDEFQRLSGIQTEFCCHLTETALRADRETHLYRIVQEGLSNVAKHARASYVIVRFEAIGQDVVLSILDNGMGFVWSPSAAASDAGHGVGLTNIHERVRLLHGYLDIESSPGNGTKIVVSVPAVSDASAEPMTISDHWLGR